MPLLTVGAVDAMQGGCAWAARPLSESARSTDVSLCGCTVIASPALMATFPTSSVRCHAKATVVRAAV